LDPLPVFLPEFGFLSTLSLLLLLQSLLCSHLNALLL
jgi:hypothetical protein